MNDLTSFDVSKQSPEQIARLFACWKEQRRRLDRRKEAAPIHARSLRIMPRLRPNSAEVEVRASDTVEARPSQSHPPQYSADFAAILGNGGDREAAPRIKSLRLRPSGGASRAGIARSRLRWALAGAASVIAVMAVAGTAYWPDGSNLHRRVTASTAEPVQAEPLIEPAREQQVALSLLPAVTGWAGPKPLLRQQLADLARWPSAAETTKAPLLAMLKPDTPAIQTASDGMDAAGLAPADASVLVPERITAESWQEFATGTGTADEADVEEARPARTASIPSGPDPRDKDRPGVSDRPGTSVAGLQGDKAAPDQSSGSAGSDDPGAGGAAGRDAAGGTNAGGSTGGTGNGGHAGGGNSGSGASNAGSGSAGGSDAGGTAGGGKAGNSNSGPDRGGIGGDGSGSGDDTDRGESGGGGDSSGGGASNGGESGGSEGGGGESGGAGESDGGNPEGGGSDGEAGESGSRGGLSGAVGGLLGGARDAIGGLGKALGGKDKGADGGKDKGGGKRGGGND